MQTMSLDVSANFTRPADTTAYAAGDLVANSTTAGSVVMLSWTIPERTQFWLRRIKIAKTNASVTNANFRLWLTTTSSVTFTNGDNGALSISASSLAATDVFGPFELDVDMSLTGSGAVGASTFDEGLHAIYAASWANGKGTLYGFLEARGAYTPGNAEVFTVSLRGNT